MSKNFAEQLFSLASEARNEEVRLEAVRLALHYLSGPPPAEPVPVPDGDAEAAALTAEQAEAMLTVGIA